MTFKRPPTVLETMVAEFVHNKAGDKPSIKRRTSALRSALTLPYDTDANRKAASHLGVRKFVQPDVEGISPTVEPSGISVASVFWALEDAESMPDSVRAAFPELTLDEWQAALRLVIHILAT